MRNGKSGSFATDMSPELIKKFDDWTRIECANSDLKFAL